MVFRGLPPRLAACGYAHNLPEPGHGILFCSVGNLDATWN